MIFFFFRLTTITVDYCFFFFVFLFLFVLLSVPFIFLVTNGVLYSFDIYSDILYIFYNELDKKKRK